jgi:hypothetical protein
MWGVVVFFLSEVGGGVVPEMTPLCTQRKSAKHNARDAHTKQRAHTRKRTMTADATTTCEMNNTPSKSTAREGAAIFWFREVLVFAEKRWLCVFTLLLRDVL